MDTEIPQYCRRCGTMLIDGVCPTHPVQTTPSVPQPSKPAIATATVTASSATAAPHPKAARLVPTAPAPQRPWFSSIPGPAVAARGKGWRYVHMWNWGAFLLCPLWLMNHGRVGRGIVFLALCVVPLLWVFALGMAIAYGIKGNKVASIGRDFVDDAEFVKVQNAWRDAGFGVALLALLAIFIGRMES
jgi:hypothetical protein